MIKKLRFLFAIITIVGICAISNLFSMESVDEKEVRIWPKVEITCFRYPDSINTAARIITGLFVRSVYLNVSKNLKTGEFTTRMYVRSISGLLRQSQEVLYPEIEKDLKAKIAACELSGLENKIN